MQSGGSSPGKPQAEAALLMWSGSRGMLWSCHLMVGDHLCSCRGKCYPEPCCSAVGLLQYNCVSSTYEEGVTDLLYCG